MTRYHEACGDVLSFEPDEDGLATHLPRCMCLATAAARYCGGREYDPLMLGYDIGVVIGLLGEGGDETEVRQALLLEWGVPDPQTESEALVSRGQLEMFKENA
jgi:hypothetical protein